MNNAAEMSNNWIEKSEKKPPNFQVLVSFKLLKLHTVNLKPFRTPTSNS